MVSLIYIYVLSTLLSLVHSELSIENENFRKQRIRVFIESICGDCHRFVANELKYIVIHPELLNYVDLDIIVFGKARIVSRDKPQFYCQFGNDGCVGNIALGCILSHSHSVTDALNVMECMYESGEYRENSIKMCSRKFDLSPEHILSCVNSEESNDIMLKAGDSTPKLTWVPAFELNDELHVDTRNFIKYVCDSIRGEKPSCCSERSHTVAIESEL